VSEKVWASGARARAKGAALGPKAPSSTRAQPERKRRGARRGRSRASTAGGPHELTAATSAEVDPNAIARVVPRVIAGVDGVIGQGIGWGRSHDPDRRSIDRARCGDGRGPGATPPNPVAAT
jgi:hypothetical protein